VDDGGDKQRLWSLRRKLVLAVAVLGAAGGLLLPYVWDASGERAADQGRAQVVANSLLRIGIVMFALWLAMPSLRKPMLWVPPGLAALGLVGIAAVAAQPRLLLIMLPALGAVWALRFVARFLGARPRG
jgi:hypothetical protein